MVQANVRARQEWIQKKPHLVSFNVIWFRDVKGKIFLRSFRLCNSGFTLRSSFNDCAGNPALLDTGFLAKELQQQSKPNAFFSIFNNRTLILPV